MCISTEDSLTTEGASEIGTLLAQAWEDPTNEGLVSELRRWRYALFAYLQTPSGQYYVAQAGIEEGPLAKKRQALLGLAEKLPTS